MSSPGKVNIASKLFPKREVENTGTFQPATDYSLLITHYSYPPVSYLCAKFTVWHSAILK